MPGRTPPLPDRDSKEEVGAGDIAVEQGYKEPTKGDKVSGTVRSVTSGRRQ